MMMIPGCLSKFWGLLLRQDLDAASSFQLTSALGIQIPPRLPVGDFHFGFHWAVAQTRTNMAPWHQKTKPCGAPALEFSATPIWLCTRFPFGWYGKIQPGYGPQVKGPCDKKFGPTTKLVMGSCSSLFLLRKLKRELFSRETMKFGVHDFHFGN